LIPYSVLCALCSYIAHLYQIMDSLLTLLCKPHVGKWWINPFRVSGVCYSYCWWENNRELEVFFFTLTKIWR
jgi:hypothetical protein